MVLLVGLLKEQNEQLSNAALLVRARFSSPAHHNTARSSPSPPPLQALRTVVMCPLKDNEACAADWSEILRATLKSILESVRNETSIARKPMLLAVGIFVLSMPDVLLPPSDLAALVPDVLAYAAQLSDDNEVRLGAGKKM